MTNPSNKMKTNSSKPKGQSKKSKSPSVEKKKLELLIIQWEYPNGYSGTATPVQYAYFLDENGDVIKKQVKVSL